MMEEEMDTGADNEWMMHGGAKIIGRWREKKEWLKGVLYIIDKADKIECISYDSLYAFVFVIHVPTTIKNDDLPFSSITIGEYDKPISKLLLKMSFLCENEQEKSGIKKILKKNPFNRIVKGVDTLENFEKEVKTQIDIFKKTYTKGKLANCPSIVFHRAFSNNESKLFLNYILNYSTDKLTSTSRNPLVYLKEVITSNTTLRLGAIAMEYAGKFIVLNKYINNLVYATADYDDEGFKKLLRKVALIFANMIVLYFNGYVHWDLHTNNVFITDDFEKNCNNNLQLLNNDNKKSCIRIIDFGRVSEDVSLKSDSDDRGMHKYFTDNSFPFIPVGTNNNNVLVSKLMDNTISDNDKPILDFFKTVLKILEKIYNADLKYNKGINPNVTRPQCFMYFYLLKFITIDDDVLKSDFFEFRGNEISTKSTIEKVKYTKEQRYVIGLIIQYLNEYTVIFSKPENATFDNMYSISETTDTTFREQFLQYQLETLRDSLDIAEYQVTTYTITPEFDLKTPKGNSIRKQRPDLERLFQSIDDIIRPP